MRIEKFVKSKNVRILSGARIHGKMRWAIVPLYYAYIIILYSNFNLRSYSIPPALTATTKHIYYYYNTLCEYEIRYLARYFYSLSDTSCAVAESYRTIFVRHRYKKVKLKLPSGRCGCTGPNILLLLIQKTYYG